MTAMLLEPIVARTGEKPAKDIPEKAKSDKPDKGGTGGGKGGKEPGPSPSPKPPRG